MIKEYENYDACGLAQLVRDKEVSPSELLQEAIARTEKHGALNAVVHRFDDRAKNSIDKGLPDGPFQGVPYLYKDVLALEGELMSLGCVLLRENRPDNTHEVVRRMEASGLVAFGRTNMSELGLAPTAENELFGATQNPWKEGYSTGGSSGGAGAVVAAGIIPMAHGGDGGGSIRIPASCCHLVGLKPSRGRNPMDVMDEPNGNVQHGVLSRSVRDTAQMLDCIQGARDVDRYRLPEPDEPYIKVIEKDPKPLRIGFITEDFAGFAADRDCKEAILKSAKLCEELGHKVEEAMPQIDGRAYNQAFKIVWAGSAGYFFRQASVIVQGKEEVSPLVRRVLKDPKMLRRLSGLKDKATGKPNVSKLTRVLGKLNEPLTPGDLWMAWNELRRAEVKLIEYFRDYDLLLSPVLGQAPWKLGTLKDNAPLEELEAQLNQYAGYTPIGNSGGFPGISLPLYLSPEGLPVGSQFLAPMGREDRLLQLAAQLERAFPWADQRPAGF